MTLEQFLTVLRRHVAGIEDRAGIRPLDVFLAQARDAGIDVGEWVSFVETALKTENPAAPGFWTAIRLIIAKLGLVSAHLAGRMEIALTANADVLESFDAYEGWRAFAEAGGYLAPKKIKSLTSIRANRPPLWLDLAILAFRGDPAGLGSILCELAESGAIDPSDLKSRLSPLQISLGQDHFLTVMANVVRAFPNSEIGVTFGQWLDEKMGTDIVGETAPADQANTDDPGIMEIIFSAAKFAFDNRGPKPILQVAA